MASSSFTDAPNADSFDPENKSVTIVINDNGEINYDEKTLQSIIDSNQQSATVTFVRVSGDGAGQDDSSTTAENMPLDALDLNPEGSGDPKANPILMLDQEQINRLENVLSSDEAKSFLGEVLANPDNNPNQSLGDILTSTGQTNVSNLTTNPEFALIGPPPPLIPNSEVLDNSLTSSSTSNTKKNNANRRKSQRQIDRELKEEAERIRKENQEILKKEKEAMKKDAKGVVEIKITPKAPAATSTTTPSGRPKRERKLPAHLKDGDFAISSKALGLNADSETATGKKKPTKNSVAEPNQASSAIEVPDEITDEILGESPKNVEDSRDAMEDQEPKEGEDKALFDSDSDDDDDDDMNSEEADSEDDPNKLWCICQQPHNNRFMICCDSCLDWYHGKCVGITKKMGKEMEEAGNEWSCPKCKTKEEKENTAQLKDKMKERVQNSSSTSTPKVKEQQTSSSATTTPTKKQPGNKSNLPAKKSAKRRSMSKDKEISGVNEPKKEEKKCFVCEKIPKEGSIYCSDDCITKHANKAIELLKKTKPKGQTDLKRPVLVTDPLSNAMLQGPSAPTEATLHSWLLSHPTFHVVLPKSSPSSKFYSTTTSKFYGSKKLTHKREAPTKVSSEKVKAALQIQNAPKPSLSGIGNTSQTKVLTASLEKPETPSPTKKSPVTPDKKFQQHEPEKKMSAPRRSSENVGVSDQEKIRKVSGSDRLTKSHVVHSSSSSSSSSSRRDSSSTSATVTGSGGSSSLSKSNSKQDVHRSRKSSISSASPKLDVDKKKDKVVRDMTTKGFKDALKLKLAKQDDNEGNEIKMEDDKLEELVKAIEKEMYLLYNRDAGTKYKAKYRSLVFNIKDEKNLGFFRKIINGNISPKVLVAMSPEQMASKELKEWRQSELKNDIEKIKSHELDLLKMGSKIVLKTHKGEEVKEAPNTIKNTESVLPDEIEKSDPKKSGKEKYKIKGANTWDHGKLETCMTKETKDCDVCSGKMTEDAFLVAKIEREKRHKEREKEKKRHKSSHKSSKHKDHHKSDRKDRDRHHRDRKDRDKEKRSSSDDKKKSSPKDQDPAKKIENKEPEVRPEDIEKKVEEILASSGASEMAKIRESSQKQFDEEIEILQDDVNEPGDIDIPALTQAEQNVPGSPDPEVLKESEVTSTVTIKTPEETLIGSTNPSVWNGEIDMPEVARFSVTAHQVSGTTDYLTYDLNEKIRIAGRIPPTTVWDYIKQVSESPTKEILLISLLPTSKDERMSYLSFYNYLKTRDRFGVVRGLGKMVKDCYVIALPKEKEIHPVMLPLDGPGLDADRDDLLLALIVRSKRKRSNDGTPIYQSIHPKVSKKSEVEKTAAAIVNLDKNPTYNPTPVDKLYDPDDDEVYDPESAFVDEKSSSRPSSSSKTSKKRSRDEPAFSSDESPSPPPPKAPVTSTSGFGAADSTKKETPKPKKIEDTKAEPMAGFKGLPTGIASILFGSSTSSTASTTTSTVTTTATGSTESRDPRKKPTPSTENKNTSAAAKIAQPPTKNTNKKPESSNKSSKTSVLGSLSDADLLAMIPDSEKSSDVKVVQEISSKNSTKSNSSTNIPKPIINVDGGSQQPKPSPKIFELSSDDSSPLRPAPSGSAAGGAYPPAPPAIRQELTAPKSSSAQGQSPGPWMQGMDPQNQPNLPWPTSTGSSSTSTTSRSRSTEKDQQFDRRDRRSSRDDYNRGRDYDRGHHHRDYDRGYDRGGGGGHRRDYDRRYSRDDRDHRERDYDRNRGDRYRDRDYDRDRDRGGYYRRESRDDRGGGGGRDDRGGDRYDHDRGGGRDDHDRTHDHEQKKIEEDGKSTKEVAITEENKVATEEFLSSFSFGEPKPPGEDGDVVPF